jgi:Xaa-Pro aminopeptidase/Xaa-Pro dipeptidase
MYKNQNSQRLEKVRKLLWEKELDGFLFSSTPNVFYLTGLKASQAYVVITEKEALLVTDARYYERAKEIASPSFKTKLILGDPTKFLKDLLKSLKISRVGFEKDRVTCELRERLRSRSYQLIGLSQPLRSLRMKKEVIEIEKIKRAVGITDEIFQKLLHILKPGLFELEVRGKIVEFAFKREAEGEAFPSIVASGEHSAIPHWESSKKIISKGPLLIDMGVLYEGYCSDFTRTLYLGKADQEFKKYYEIVKTAWFKAFERVKTGVPVYEIDKRIREYFQKKGVLSYFTHSTGHGLGIEIHEFPRIYYHKSKKYLKNQPYLEEGMVFTIEPGLYFPGRFGIRLENVVFVEEGRGKIYSENSLELLEL